MIGFEAAEGEVKIFNEPVYFPAWGSLWVPRDCLLELGARIKQWAWGGSYRSEDLWEQLGIRKGVMGVQVFC